MTQRTIMKKNYRALACFLQIILSGCTDYVKLDHDESLDERHRFSPIIDTKHISPHPSRLVETIGVGKNCRGVVFQVPPIEDYNKKDRLFYLWFIDDKLALPQSIILPSSRSSAIITLHIDQQFLLSHFETKIPSDFFNRIHVIEFFVSDVEYTIPESRYIEDLKKSNEDYAYWIVSFNNDPCV